MEERNRRATGMQDGEKDRAPVVKKGKKGKDVRTGKEGTRCEGEGKSTSFGREYRASVKKG